MGNNGRSYPVVKPTAGRQSDPALLPRVHQLQISRDTAWQPEK
jgi:hypothetical protein